MNRAGSTSQTPATRGSSRSSNLTGVYRIDTDGSVHRIIANATKPNGVYVAPDQSTLYVADFDTGFLDGPRLSPEELASIPPLQMTLWAYPLNPDGTVGERRALVNYLPKFGPDGITADSNGNLYVAVRDSDAAGIRVYTPARRSPASPPGTSCRPRRNSAPDGTRTPSTSPPAKGSTGSR